MIERELLIMDGKANNGPEIGEIKPDKTNLSETDFQPGRTGLGTSTPNFPEPHPFTSTNHDGGMVTLERPSTSINPDPLKKMWDTPTEEPLDYEAKRNQLRESATRKAQEMIVATNTFSTDPAEKARFMKEQIGLPPRLKINDPKLYQAAATGKNLDKITPEFQRQGAKEAAEEITAISSGIAKNKEPESETPPQRPKLELTDDLLEAYLEQGAFGEYQIVKEVNLNGKRGLEYFHPDQPNDKAILWIGQKFEPRLLMYAPDPQRDYPDVRTGIIYNEITTPEGALHWLNRSLKRYEERIDEFDPQFASSMVQTINSGILQGEVNEDLNSALLDMLNYRVKLQAIRFRANFNLKDLGAIAGTVSNNESSIFYRPYAKKDPTTGTGEVNHFRLEGLYEAYEYMQHDSGIYWRKAGEDRKKGLSAHLQATCNIDKDRADLVAQMAEKEMIAWGEAAYYDGIIVKDLDAAKRQFGDHLTYREIRYDAAGIRTEAIVPAQWSEDGFISEEILRAIYDSPANRDPASLPELRATTSLEELYARFYKEHFNLLDFGDSKGSGGSIGGSGPRDEKRTYHEPVFIKKPGINKRMGIAKLQNIAYTWVSSTIRLPSLDSPAVANMTELVNRYLKDEKDLSPLTSKLTTSSGVIGNQGAARNNFVEHPTKSILNVPFVNPDSLREATMHGTTEERRKAAGEVLANYFETINTCLTALEDPARLKASAEILDELLTYKRDIDRYFRDGYTWLPWQPLAYLSIIDEALHARAITHADAHHLIHKHVGSRLRAHQPHHYRILTEEINEQIVKRFFRLVFKDWKP